MQELPQTKLKEIVSFKTGKLDSNAAVEGGKYPFFTCAPETLRIDDYAFDTTAILLAGNNATGIFPIKYHSGKFNCYQRTYVIESIVPDIADLSYLYFAIQIQLKFLQSMSIGAATKFLTKRILDNLKIPLFPISTQKKIARILSAYDDLIENNLKRIKLLEEMAQITYEEWFVRLRFPCHETTSINPETGLPKGWEARAVSEVIAINPKTSVPKGSLQPYIPMQSVSTTSMVIEPIEARNPSGGAKFKDGDTLVARITPCLENGKTGFVRLPEPNNKGTGSTEFIVLRETSLVSRFYIYCLARSNYFRGNSINAMSGSDGRQRVNPKVYDKLKINFPPQNIMKDFDIIAKPCFEQIGLLSQKNQRLREAHDILLPRLMTGMIDVEQYNPADLLKEVA